jgi:hypothetical protein
MDEKYLPEVWEQILRKKWNFSKFEQVELPQGNYLRTNYKLTEPNGYQRSEKWLLDFRGTISPSEIFRFNQTIQKQGFDVGAVFVASTITGSSGEAAIVSDRVRIYDIDTLASLAKEQLEIAQKYEIPIEMALPTETRTFLSKLSDCKSGKASWNTFQDLVGEIFCYLFVPPLGKPEPQSRAEDGLEIRDFVFPNRADSGFWALIRSEYKGMYAVVEAKNKDDLEKNDVLQLEDYLQAKQLGLFGIIVSRKLSEPASDQRRKAYSSSSKMIVLLDDNDVCQMLLKKGRGEKPEEVLFDRIDSYRIGFRF